MEIFLYVCMGIFLGSCIDFFIIKPIHVWMDKRDAKRKGREYDPWDYNDQYEDYK